jgi:hypothetical protein
VKAVLAIAALAACGGGGMPSAPETPPEAAPAWRVRAAGGMDPIDVGTTDPALVDAGACRACHTAIADEWATSRHALAWTNGIFQREYQAKPQAWCVNCHAPMPVQQAELATAGDAGAHPLADQGINCATCHVRAGKLVAARRAATSPHDTIVDATFGTPAFCADCHQFTFPVLAYRGGAALRMTKHPMQDTVASFLRGPYATEPDGCMACHGSPTNHAFAGGHDAGMLGAAITVEWCRRDAEIVVTLTNAAAGHSVPTGDIHRHMNLRVWKSSAPESLYEGFLGRRFEPADDGGKVTTWDSSIAPGKHQRHAIAIASLGEDDEPINLEFNYVYIADEFPHRDRIPTEPGSTTIVHWREEAARIPACGVERM